MVWKTNLSVTDKLTTFEGFLCDVFGWWNDFSTRAYFRDPKDAFKISSFVDERHFPQHIFFANFQCLRCGLCCKNYEDVEVAEKLVLEWQIEGRDDVLRYVDEQLSEIYSDTWTGCPLCRKVRGKPYYSSRINSYKEFIPVCKAYLCSKSVPVAHINFRGVDELIEFVGLEKYFDLIEKDWDENFDYSRSEYKTHKRKDNLIT